ncbi:MAG TPA: hypothetical protein VN622_14180 [Clostridia bacterium]|nr:hypothetical protein [Clostridia bacterium]
MSTMPLCVGLFGGLDPDQWDEPASNAPVRRPDSWACVSASSATLPGIRVLVPAEATMRAWRMPAAFNSGLRRTLRSLDELSGEPEEDEYGPARPSLFAHAMATELLRSSAALIDPFPAGSACTDTAAGLRITWRKQNRQLRLVLPPTPEGRSYLYAQAGSQHQITDNLTYDSFAAWLQWVDRGSE